MDRQAASRALAKAIAYVECGKSETAAEWLDVLVVLFQEAGVDTSRITGPAPTPEPVVYDLSAAATRLGSQLL